MTRSASTQAKVVISLLDHSVRVLRSGLELSSHYCGTVGARSVGPMVRRQGTLVRSTLPHLGKIYNNMRLQCFETLYSVLVDSRVQVQSHAKLVSGFLDFLRTDFAAKLSRHFI
jgi:hypothetical protein